MRVFSSSSPFPPCTRRLSKIRHIIVKTYLVSPFRLSLFLEQMYPSHPRFHAVLLFYLVLLKHFVKSGDDPGGSVLVRFQKLEVGREAIYAQLVVDVGACLVKVLFCTEIISMCDQLTMKR